MASTDPVAAYDQDSPGGSVGRAGGSADLLKDASATRPPGDAPLAAPVSDVPDDCLCPGYPCEHVPPPTIQTIDKVGYKLAYTRPVTLAMADELDRAGLWNVADLARKYAVDRPRWWYRLTRRSRG